MAVAFLWNSAEVEDLFASRTAGIGPLLHSRGIPDVERLLYGSIFLFSCGNFRIGNAIQQPEKPLVEASR